MTDPIAGMIRGVGGRVHSEGHGTFAGRPLHVIELDVQDTAAAITFLTKLAQHYGRTPEVRDLAADLMRPWIAPTPTDIGRVIHGFTRAHVAFQNEDDEIFREPLLTVSLGLGDCDDHTLLNASLAVALGLDARAKGVAPPTGGEIEHVCAIFDCPPRGWTWCETTVDARFGEAPFDAVKRLGAHRTDITG